jgi:hypothetical protein
MPNLCPNLARSYQFFIYFGQLHCLTSQFMGTVAEKLNFTISYKTVADTTFKWCWIIRMLSIVCTPAWIAILMLWHTMSTPYQERRSKSWEVSISIKPPIVPSRVRSLDRVYSLTAWAIYVVPNNFIISICCKCLQFHITYGIGVPDVPPPVVTPGCLWVPN